MTGLDKKIETHILFPISFDRKTARVPVFESSKVSKIYYSSRENRVYLDEILRKTVSDRRYDKVEWKGERVDVNGNDHPPGVSDSAG